jgi:hypothetical protein
VWIGRQLAKAGSSGVHGESWPPWLGRGDPFVCGACYPIEMAGKVVLLFFNFRS